jgi:phosphoribosyl 1,2-cyclic phosphodiesterase
VRLTLLGVRGSTPAPGTDFARYGGHTSCVAVTADGAEAPTLVLDAGTGIRGLPGLLGGEAFAGSILLTHLHWDHWQGLPFCPAVDRPDARTDLYLPAEGNPVDLLARGMSPPLFPIDPGGLLGAWRFLAAPPGTCVIEGFTVTHAPITHKGGLTYGIRVERDGVSMAYLPDHAPQLGSAAAEDLARDVDVLLHDGQFLDSERVVADAYGHATVTGALDFASRCGASRLMLTHHAPGRTDTALDALAADLSVEPAREGTVLTVTRSRPWIPSDAEV